MLKIRLMRIGGKKKPFYRVVVVEERSKRTGSYVELLGTYNPLTEPKEIKLNQSRIDYWIKQGAQPSQGYLRIIGKAKQRPPRKAKRPADGGKKEKKEEPKTPEAPAAEVPVEEAKSETVEASGAVESAPEIEVAENSASQPIESSDASQSDEPTPEKTEGEKNEGSA